jgi:hypothetical protein
MKLNLANFVGLPMSAQLKRADDPNDPFQVLQRKTKASHALDHGRAGRHPWLEALPHFTGVGAVFLRWHPPRQTTWPRMKMRRSSG